MICWSFVELNKQTYTQTGSNSIRHANTVFAQSSASDERGHGNSGTARVRRCCERVCPTSTGQSSLDVSESALREGLASGTCHAYVRVVVAMRYDRRCIDEGFGGASLAVKRSAFDRQCPSGP